jgi:CRISPR-associated protein (TIGR02584 family)
MTPQVITETLHALCVGADQPFPVNEIRLVTTSVGRQQVVNTLLTGKKLEQFLSDHGLAPIHFDAHCIEVIRDDDGAELSDIQTPDQNRLAADCITEAVRRFTEPADTALHVSLAGGRKTMGYYMGYALSLYGRAQDRLSHVLVDAEFEGLKDFFYPTAEPRVVEGRAGRYLDTANARVMLAEIPFVRLRGTLPPRLLSGKTSFSEAVRWSNLDEQPERLEVDLRNRMLTVAGEYVRLTVKQLAVYAAFARGVKEDDADFEGSSVNRQLTRAVAEEFARIHGLRRIPESTEALISALGSECDDLDGRTLKALQAGIGIEYLQPVLSQIKRRFTETLGPALADPYLVRVKSHVHVSGRTRQDDRKIPLYGLTLGSRQIRFLS